MDYFVDENGEQKPLVRGSASYETGGTLDQWEQQNLYRKIQPLLLQL